MKGDWILVALHAAFIVALLATVPLIIRDESWWLFVIVEAAIGVSIWTIITITIDARRNR